MESLVLLLLLFGPGLDRLVASCPELSRLSPSLSLTGAFCSALFSSSCIGLMISVVPICSTVVCLGGEQEGLTPILSLTGLFLLASLFVWPSLSLTGVLLWDSSCSSRPILSKTDVLGGESKVLGGVCWTFS